MWKRALAVVGLSIAASCHPPSTSETPHATAGTYQRDAMWLCRPDLADDACHVDLSATELLPDGSRVIERHAAAASPEVDCFYIYPTVDLRLRAGNHTDFDDTEPMRRTASAQIARFSEVCAVYAPLYRQATIGTYFGSAEDKARTFGVAYADVAEAFDAYLAHWDKGRKLVIIGHSQGAQMAAMLLRDRFDRDEAMRKRLLVAMPIGFHFDAPVGAAKGGTFSNLAACTSDGETGCVVAYRTLAAGDAPDPRFWPPPNGHALCVNPAGVGRDTPLSRAYFPSKRAGVDGVETPFVVLRDFYRAGCRAGPGGRDFLEVAEAPSTGDRRVGPVDLARHRGALGLHLFDLQLAQGDLIDLVKHKLAAAR